MYPAVIESESKMNPLMIIKRGFEISPWRYFMTNTVAAMAKNKPINIHRTDSENLSPDAMSRHEANNRSAGADFISILFRFYSRHPHWWCSLTYAIDSWQSFSRTSRLISDNFFT